MLMFSTTATIGPDGMISVRVPHGVRRGGLHEITVIVRDVSLAGGPAPTSAEVDPVEEAVGGDPAAEAAAYQAVYRGTR